MGETHADNCKESTEVKQPSLVPSFWFRVDKFDKSQLSPWLCSAQSPQTQCFSVWLAGVGRSYRSCCVVSLTLSSRSVLQPPSPPKDKMIWWTIFFLSWSPAIWRRISLILSAFPSCLLPFFCVMLFVVHHHHAESKHQRGRCTCTNYIQISYTCTLLYRTKTNHFISGITWVIFSDLYWSVLVSVTLSTPSIIWIFPFCYKSYTHYCAAGLTFLFQPIDRDRSRTAVWIC